MAETTAVVTFDTTHLNTMGSLLGLMKDNNYRLATDKNPVAFKELVGMVKTVPGLMERIKEDHWFSRGGTVWSFFMSLEAVLERYMVSVLVA